MDLAVIIGQLREEHRLISNAIAKLEALAAGSRPVIADLSQPQRRRGRPPGSRNKRPGAPGDDTASEQ
jgi:hypothetical protein